MRKIETLQTYLEQLERNLESLKANGRNDNRVDIKKAEQTIQLVQQELQLQYAEVSDPFWVFFRSCCRRHCCCDNRRLFLVRVCVCV